MRVAVVYDSDGEPQEWENARTEVQEDGSVKVIEDETDTELAVFAEGDYFGYGFSER